jgi:hypothetical protein
VPVSLLVRGSPLPVLIRVRQGLEKGRKVFGDGRPKHVKVDVEVVVHKPVTHAGCGRPGNIGKFRTGLIAYLLRRLSDELDQLGECEAQQFVAAKVAT